MAKRQVEAPERGGGCRVFEDRKARAREATRPMEQSEARGGLVKLRPWGYERHR